MSPPPTVEELAEAARRLRRETRASDAGELSAKTAATLIVAQVRERYPSYIADLEDASGTDLVSQICQSTARPRKEQQVAGQDEQSDTDDLTEQRPAAPPPLPPRAQGAAMQAASC